MVRGSYLVIRKPRPLAVVRNRRLDLNSVALLAPLRSVQFSSACIPYHWICYRGHNRMRPYQYHVFPTLSLSTPAIKL